jgi:hypothetical protein
MRLTPYERLAHCVANAEQLPIHNISNASDPVQHPRKPFTRVRGAFA